MKKDGLFMSNLQFDICDLKCRSQCLEIRNVSYVTCVIIQTHLLTYFSPIFINLIMISATRMPTTAPPSTSPGKWLPT